MILTGSQTPHRSSPAIGRLFRPLLVAFALALFLTAVSDAHAAPSFEQQYEKAKQDMEFLKSDSKRGDWREPWEKLAQSFFDLHEKYPRWRNRPAALFRSALAMEELAKRSMLRQDAQAAVDRYGVFLKSYASHVLADDALFGIARIKAERFNDFSGAQEALNTIQNQYPRGDVAPEAKLYAQRLKAALEAAYNLAVRMTESEEYDAESLKYVEELLADAKALLEDGNAEQTAVDQMGKDLTTAMAKVRLSAALKKVAVSEEMLAASTEESAAAYRAALAEAEELLKAKELTWEEAKAAAENVEAMALSLEHKVDPEPEPKPEEKPSKPNKGSTSQVSDSDYWAEVVEKINATEKGGKVNAKLDEGAMVPATVIDALKNKGVTGIFEIGGKDYAVNGAGELKGYNAAAVYYTSDEIKAMAGTAPAASGNAPAANSNPETGGEVAAAEPAAPEAVVPAAPVAPEVPAVIEPVVPAAPEAPAAQAEAPVETAEAGMPVWAIVAIVIAAAAVIGGAALIVVRRKHEN